MKLSYKEVNEKIIAYGKELYESRNTFDLLSEGYDFHVKKVFENTGWTQLEFQDESKKRHNEFMKTNPQWFDKEE